MGRCLSNFNQKLTKRNVLLLWAGSEYLGNKQLTPIGTICQAGMFPFLLLSSDIETGQKFPVEEQGTIPPLLCCSMPSQCHDNFRWSPSGGNSHRDSRVLTGIAGHQEPQPHFRIRQDSRSPSSSSEPSSLEIIPLCSQGLCLSS